MAESDGTETAPGGIPVEFAVKLVIVAFISIALYNFIELNVIIFTTFKHRHGLYFWSFLISTWGVCFNASGYLMRNLELVENANIFATVIIIGWVSMVSGQSVVLYSRLHLIMRNEKRLAQVLKMIIFNGIIMHIPIIVLVYGTISHGDIFDKPYAIYEKVQLSVFFFQEVVISGLYMWETSRMLRLKKTVNHNIHMRQVMSHLTWVNISVILLDVTILGLEFANYFDIQTAWKPLVYSIKLKAEFNILNKLVDFTMSSQQEHSYGTRSHVGTANNGTNVAMDTFSGKQGTKNGGHTAYEAQAGRGEGVGGDGHDDGTIMQTTEIAVKSERARDTDIDSLDSLEQGLGISTGGGRKKDGSGASATSSEVLFARDAGHEGTGF